MSTTTQFDEAQMVDVQEAIVRAIETKDADSFAELYAHDAALLPPDGSVIEGREAIRDGFAAMLEAGFAKQTVVNARLVLDNDSAIEEGQAIAEFHNDGEVDVQRCNYLIVHRRQSDGSWRMDRDMWTAIPADAPEPRIS